MGFWGEARGLDERDGVKGVRGEFLGVGGGVVYLDGNSLGRVSSGVRGGVVRVLGEWEGDVVEGWHGWLGVGREAGGFIGRVVGAEEGEVVLSDSTSVNLYKLAVAAVEMQKGRGRDVIVVDRDDFPTDRYVLEGVARERGVEVRWVQGGIDEGVGVGDVERVMDGRVGLVCLSHVAYRSGAVADIRGITEVVHRHGGMVLWDLCHSAGAIEVGLAEANVDLAVGCTYKYLNGGPGAPAFLYVRRDLQDVLVQPIHGWFGQTDQFAMGDVYEPPKAIERFLVGTPPILSGVAALEGARISARVGIGPIAEKARALTGFALKLTDAWLTPLGFRVASPRAAERRGAHLTLHHPQAWQMCQALKAAKVIPDYRPPERLRLGFAPLYTRFEDVYTGLSRLRDIAAEGRHLTYPAVPRGLT
ncbi:kynureninase [Actinocorallia sp. A-T 12471]|uniref:kynureninase n=1 Tax=Actinocorallia sp. A-T 12471 TaxID=3089813 RepID=UPI0029D06033|nr:aminotransferase class V-fold PLP-dependent enzyme [Actinocorallia sp. A-T 12471]MDX6740131.1 aminotransferase class V-fold PLP-dependent enzyme [Actinocorallia sp. A-T 12471]